MYSKATARTRWRLKIVGSLGGALVIMAGGFPSAPAEARSTRDVSVVVRAVPGEEGAARSLVRKAGGRIVRSLGLIDGFSARVPSSSVDDLLAARSVVDATPNRRVTLSATTGTTLGTGGGTPYETTAAIGARKLWDQGVTGRGVDVALIDSGIAPVNGLRVQGKVLHGPDFSWESQAPNLRYLDTYGHGTHMAGIIAGRDDTVRAPYSRVTGRFVGVAPDARIVSVKVADAKGLTDVSQVIAAIDWVVSHRNKNGMNIRVLNLSFGTDGTQTYLLDPLSFAVEKAWHKGIVVVVSAGNTGYGDVSLNNPAFNPFVIAVGADDTRGTLSANDDVVPNWSTAGNLLRNPDVVAPGKSIVSLRDRGSYIDNHHPEGRVGTRFFKGSGTSQAAAVVSGAAALLLQSRPGLSPNQVKKALTATATRLPRTAARAQGNGLINLPKAKSHWSLLSAQLNVPATGLGSLQLARGSNIISSAGEALVGEVDIFGASWLQATILNLGALLGGVFNGAPWVGEGLINNALLGPVWKLIAWGRTDWAGSRWTDGSWTGSRWTGSRWTGSRWTGSRWTGSRWTGDMWSTAGWGG